MKNTNNEIRKCNRCKSTVKKSELEEYSYQCLECDEDLYTFETYKEALGDFPKYIKEEEQPNHE